MGIELVQDNWKISPFSCAVLGSANCPRQIQETLHANNKVANASSRWKPKSYQLLSVGHVKSRQNALAWMHISRFNYSIHYFEYCRTQSQRTNSRILQSSDAGRTQQVLAKTIATMSRLPDTVNDALLQSDMGAGRSRCLARVVSQDNLALKSSNNGQER